MIPWALFKGIGGNEQQNREILIKKFIQTSKSKNSFPCTLKLYPKNL